MIRTLIVLWPLLLGAQAAGQCRSDKAPCYPASAGKKEPKRNPNLGETGAWHARLYCQAEEGQACQGSPVVQVSGNLEVRSLARFRSATTNRATIRWTCPEGGGLVLITLRPNNTTNPIQSWVRCSTNEWQPEKRFVDQWLGPTELNRSPALVTIEHLLEYPPSECHSRFLLADVELPATWPLPPEKTWLVLYRNKPPFEAAIDGSPVIWHRNEGHTPLDKWGSYNSRHCLTTKNGDDIEVIF